MLFATSGPWPKFLHGCALWKRRGCCDMSCIRIYVSCFMNTTISPFFSRLSPHSSPPSVPSFSFLRPCYVSQVGLEPRPPCLRCLDYKCTPPHLGQVQFFKRHGLVGPERWLRSEGHLPSVMRTAAQILEPMSHSSQMPAPRDLIPCSGLQWHWYTHTHP